MSKRSPAEPQPEFFVDRSLGSEVVPQALRDAGLTIHVMGDVYPDLQDVADDIWIPEATENGWVLLTKDKAIRRNELEKEAVRACKARMFCIPNANMTGAAMAERLVANRDRIIVRSREDGPYIYTVHENRLQLVFPLG